MAKTEPIRRGSASDAQNIADMQFLLAAAGVGIWRYDGGTNTFMMDDTCRQMFELEDGEELGMENMRQRIHPDDLDAYWTAVKSSLESGDFAVSYRVINRDGSIRYISGRGRTLPPAPGAAPQTMGVCIDVTDRHNLKERLRRTEDRMQQLADGVPGLFSYIDSEWQVQFMSSQYRDLLGLGNQSVIGKHVGDIVGWDKFAERKPRYAKALAGDTVHHETVRTTPDGQTRYFTITHAPYRTECGHIHGVMTLAIDITERRAIEQKLEAKSEELRRSNHDLEQFAYVASHDLKAPLRAIEVLVQWLREDLADVETGEVQENLGLLSQRTQRLNRLLDDLLEYSRAGRRVGQVAEVNTRELVQDIVTLLGPADGMRVIADDSLPVMTTHVAPLEQVLRNLINNAIKHHPGDTGTVRVSAQQQGESVMFAVEDDGAGIAEEYADKVFKMFQTLQPRDEREGSGMGLAIVQRIIDWQGGRVWFHPGPGNRGTVFKFIWTKVANAPEGSLKGDEHGSDRDPSRQHLAG
ncbi:MAG: ATP-binding protein [Gammaproteobacteria bacterium]|nr:ATP-binding protein [Gammaproteobacteria bacterium]